MPSSAGDFPSIALQVASLGSQFYKSIEAFREVFFFQVGIKSVSQKNINKYLYLFNITALNKLIHGALGIESINKFLQGLKCFSNINETLHELLLSILAGTVFSYK